MGDTKHSSLEIYKEMVYSRNIGGQTLEMDVERNERKELNQPTQTHIAGLYDQILLSHHSLLGLVSVFITF